MKEKIKWGILGLGKIATKFAQDLQLSDTSILQGVASRDLVKAQEFGEKFSAVRHYGSYEALADDPDVDAIYIATPHVFHFENTMMCLKHGKAVLCEKPMGINTLQVQAMVEEARSRNLFLMEGMWTRFIPATEKLMELQVSKAIGDVQYLTADFGFKAPYDPEGRLFNKQLGGGSLLDVGIYPIYLSLLTLGVPKDIKAMARMTDTGVDGYCSMLLDYDNRAQANLASSILADTPVEAFIYGSEGKIKVHRSFHHSNKVSVYKSGNEEVFEIPYQGNGYYHEIEAVNGCLANGDTESSKFPLQSSLNLMAIIDQVKKEIGLEYKG
ncbi:MAG: Gfo/Idh/MocA family oxidoreductase [Bacteroidota bacterium]